MSSRAQGLHRLSATEVKSLKHRGWHADGGGLYLEVDANGNKRWALRITVAGRRRDFGLGPLHKVSLADARERAARYRVKAYRGIDPLAPEPPAAAASVEPASPPPARPVAKGPTFEDAAEEVFRQRSIAWTNGKHYAQWLNTLRDYAYPAIGNKPVGAIGAPDVLAILSPIWLTKPETARRVRQRIGIIFDWARAAGHRQRCTVMDDVADALPRQARKTKHYAALPYDEVGEFIAALHASSTTPATRLAFEFLILTAGRSKEVRHALWCEIDLDEKTWTIPGADTATGRRMKAGREHIVPLSKRCLAILQEARELGSAELVFPDDATGKAMSENRFLNARDASGYSKEQLCPHGFRSSFRDWAAEETDFPSEVVEMALAHAIKNKVEAAYRRGALLAKRRELMQAWANYAAQGSLGNACQEKAQVAG